MKGYKHLTLHEREKIAVWRSSGLSFRDIGLKLDRHPSSLCREVNRNSRPSYWPNKAHERALLRKQEGHKRRRLKDRAIRNEVELMLTKGWSPELIAGRLKRDHPQWDTVSHEAIYQWIYIERPDLVGYLLRAHPKRRHRWKTSQHKTRIPERVSIQNRPTHINERREPGHWEADLVVGSGSAALQVAVERSSRLTRIKKVRNKSAEASRKALYSLLSPVPAQLRRSITYDNGLENVEHNVLNKDLKTLSWFCEPYHSWEKGQVENTNGLIRRFIPKRSRLDDLSDDKIKMVEDWINDRPKKVLGFRTPNEVFASCVALTP